MVLHVRNASERNEKQINHDLRGNSMKLCSMGRILLDGGPKYHIIRNGKDYELISMNNIQLV